MARRVGLILAGGQSRRMGRDKATLQLGGISFMDRAKSLLSKSGCASILISRPQDMADRFVGGGPLAGIDAAVAKLENDAQLLVTPIDMPLLEPSLLAGLLHSGPGTHYQGHPLPMYLQVTDPLRALLSAVLGTEKADRSLFHMIRVLGVRSLPPPLRSEHLFDNCNTPKQFKSMGGTGET